MPDALSPLRTGLVAIIDADATLQGLMGRATELVVAFGDLRLDGALPVIAYALIGFAQSRGDNDTREGTVQFTVVAHGSGALATVESILWRLETINWSTALDGQGVDAAARRYVRRYTADADIESGPVTGRGQERGDLDIELVLSRVA